MISYKIKYLLISFDNPVMFPSSYKFMSWILQDMYFFFFFKTCTLKKNFIQFLKVTFHLQLLKNIGYIPCVVQYILEPILHRIVCTSHSQPLYRPSPSTGNH